MYDYRPNWTPDGPITIINWLQEIWCEYETDLCSSEHYLSSGENKTWKKLMTSAILVFFSFFRPYFHCCSGSVHYSKDKFNIHVFIYMIFTVIYSSLNRFIWNQHNDQLPVGLLAQLVISHTGLNFFRPCFHYCSGSVHCCKDHLHIQVFIHSSHVWFSYIHSQEIWCYM